MHRDSITRLNGTLASAHQYRDQMRAFMTGSTDAIAHVQEGIVVDVNPAWVELFGRQDASDAARPAADGPVRRAQSRRVERRAGRRQCRDAGPGTP